MFFDAHSHIASREGERLIRQDYETIGIHPWQVKENTLENDLLTFDRMIAERMEKAGSIPLLAIGECGMDKCCNVPLEMQKQAFIHQVEESEKLHLPLIIHCVKCTDEILAIHKKITPRSPWIFHGFRGKPEQARQLLSKGFYLSFGFKYNKESLRMCPAHRLFLETDTDTRPVSQLYEQVSRKMSWPFEKLKADISENARLVFFPENKY